MAQNTFDWVPCHLPKVPNSPAPDLLFTNMAPSSSQTVAIKDSIHSVDAIKEQLDAELNTVMRTFDHRRKDLVQFAQRHERLLAAERRLPLEILERIFIHCVIGGNVLNEKPSASIRALLCAVCRTWRDIVISTRLLWTHFSLVMRPGDERDNVDICSTWLPRAGNLPMSVEVRNLSGVLTLAELRDVLSVYSASWEDVTLSFMLWPDEDTDLEKCSAMTADIVDHMLLPSLRDLRVTWNGLTLGWSLSSSIVPLITRSACSLQRLELTYPQDNIPDSDLINCLRAVPTLTHFKLHFGFNPSCVTERVLNYLTHTSVGPERCILPNLTDAELDLYRSAYTFETLLAMIRSRCTMHSEGSIPPVARLRTLTLLFDDFPLDDVFVEELNEIASATQLKLTIIQKDRSPGSWLPLRG